jgi:hypothetical protein
MGLFSAVINIRAFKKLNSSKVIRSGRRTGMVMPKAYILLQI